MEITSKPNSIIIDGREVPKSSVSYDHVDDGIQFRSGLSGKTGYYAFNDITANGQMFDNKEDLYDWLSANSFKSGGASGEGLESIEAGDGISIDKSNPKSPIISAIGTADGVQWSDVSQQATPLSIAQRHENGNLDTGMAQFPENAVPLAQLNAVIQDREDVSKKGQSNGYAPLDASGLVPLQHLNVSGLTFKGAWDASTNTPNLLNGTGNVGDFYKAGVAGTHNFGNGEYVFNEGDWVIFAAGVWQRLGSTELVASVNGKLGMVVITKSDVGLGNSDNTSDANKPVSNAVALALTGKEQANVNIQQHISSTSNPHGTTKAQVGLGSVDNTSDLNKPISTATKNYIDGKQTLLAEVTNASAFQALTVNIPANAPDLLRIEIYITDTLQSAWVGMRINGVTTAAYKSVIQGVNNASYSLFRYSSQTQMPISRSLSTNNDGVQTGTLSTRIEGTINNVALEAKVFSGSAYIAGTSASSQPDISNAWGSGHGVGIANVKITSLEFRTNPPSAGLGAGTKIKVYGIK